MEEEFWKHWKKRWPHASCDHDKIKGSANYQETRAAFEAGFEAAQQMLALDGFDSEQKCMCPADGLWAGCPVHGTRRK